MAQHIDIFKSNNKQHQSIVRALQDRFTKGVDSIRSSVKFVEIEDSVYKLHANDLVFETFRTLNSEKESLEIHFDTTTASITEIFIVK